MGRDDHSQEKAWLKLSSFEDHVIKSCRSKNRGGQGKEDGGGGRRRRLTHLMH